MLNAAQCSIPYYKYYAEIDWLAFILYSLLHFLHSGKWCALFSIQCFQCSLIGVTQSVVLRRIYRSMEAAALKWPHVETMMTLHEMKEDQNWSNNQTKCCPTWMKHDAKRLNIEKKIKQQKNGQNGRDEKGKNETM